MFIDQNGMAMAVSFFLKTDVQVQYLVNLSKALSCIHIHLTLCSGIPSDEEQATGLEKIVLQAAKKEL